MTDHPAIVALARLFNPHAWACEGLKIDDCDTKSDRHDTLEQARAAYAAVLRDLMQPSEAMRKAGSEQIDVVMLPFKTTDYSGWAEDVMGAMLRARAREIGVEVE